jgi:hypothetical protein
MLGVELVLGALLVFVFVTVLPLHYCRGSE